jgi:hypothetical protein
MVRPHVREMSLRYENRFSATHVESVEPYESVPVRNPQAKCLHSHELRSRSSWSRCTAMDNLYQNH